MANSGYKISATINAMYAPLISRNRAIHDQTPKSNFAQKRESGASNIDLWVDGALYPHDPIDSRRPHFQSVSQLLEFVAEGKNGLLGYTERLRSRDSQFEFSLNEAQREISMLREGMQQFMSVCEERDQLLMFSKSETSVRERIAEENQTLISCSKKLKSDLLDLQLEFTRMQASFDEHLSCARATIEENRETSLQTEIDFWVYTKTQKEAYEKRLSELSSELKRTKATLRRREIRLEKLIKTPYGYRSKVRPRKDVRDLAPRGGQAKRTARFVRSLLVSRTVVEIQTRNAENGTREQLCGNKEIQEGTAKVLASMLSKGEVIAMCESSKLSTIGVRMAIYYLDQIGKSVGPNDILETCDRNGITHAGYGAIYKKFKGAIQSVGKGLRIGCLPNPHTVSVTRKMLNLKLGDYVGEYYSINNTLEVPATAESKIEDPIEVKLNDNNSIFVDVEQVQRTMVELYNVTVEGKFQIHTLLSYEISATVSPYFFWLGLPKLELY